MGKAPCFSGNLAKEDPDLFCRTVRRFFRGSQSKEKCELFHTLLAPHSVANMWFQELSLETKNWEELEMEFKEQWFWGIPPVPDAGAIEYIIKSLPALEDIEMHDEFPRAGSLLVPRHILWIQQPYYDAVVNHYSSSLAEQARHIHFATS